MAHADVWVAQGFCTKEGGKVRISRVGGGIEGNGGWVRILQTLDRGTTLALRAFVWSFAVQIRSVCMHVYTKVLMKCAICRQVFAL